MMDEEECDVPSAVLLDAGMCDTQTILGNNIYNLYYTLLALIIVGDCNIANYPVAAFAQRT